MFDTLLVFLTVWLIFGVIGIDLFAGKFYHCYNVTSDEYYLSEMVENKSECYFLQMESNDTRWRNQEFHFDHMGMAFVMLLRLVSVRTGSDSVCSVCSVQSLTMIPQINYTLKLSFHIETY